MKRGIRKRAISRLSGFVGGICSRAGWGKLVELHASEKPVVVNSVFRIRNVGLRVPILGSAGHFYP